MKRLGLVLLVLLAPLFAALSVAPAHAQGGFSQTLKGFRHGMPGSETQVLGQDFWFAPIYSSNTGSVLQKPHYLLFVTSPNSGTVHLQLGTTGPFYSGKIRSMHDTTFAIPESWTMSSSGIVEQKGIHVWSTDASLSCHFISSVGGSSDGSSLIPTLCWGTEYVVAGYAPLFEGFGTYVYDLPSEFSIVASHDNTRVIITPTADIRVENPDSSCCGCLLAARGSNFQVFLNAGESVQMKSTCVQDCDNFDLTGTTISSNQPIGVIGGSDAPNIPCDFPSANHVCHMLPPVRSWGKTYYSLPFYPPPGSSPSHTASTFLVIATKPGQVIQRYDNDHQQTQVYFTASKKYDLFWRNDIDQGSRWTSDTTFLLVQYINSSTFPDGTPTGQGAPSEVVLSPIEHYTKSVLFQLPGVVDSTVYTNYVNIIAKPGDNHVMLDGASVIGMHTIYVDGDYSGYRASSVSPGAHMVTSDSGVSVYCYGYGRSYGVNDAYAWAGALGDYAAVSTDSVPPMASFTPQSCQSVRVWLSDSGVNESTLAGMIVDTARNIAFRVDSLWVSGDSISYFDASVIDPTMPALLTVNVYDLAGNWTTVTTSYVPTSTARIGPTLQNFGAADSGHCTYRFDTLVNNGIGTFTFARLQLTLGNQGFSIDSAITTPLAQGEKRLIKICFRPTVSYLVFDTLSFTAACGEMSVLLTGNGGPTSFALTDHDFDTTVLGASVAGAAMILNQSTLSNIRIDSVWVDDPWDFSITPNQVGHVAPPSFLIAPQAFDTVQFHFKTSLLQGAGQYETKWHALSRAIIGPGESGVRTGTLTGYVNESASVSQPIASEMSLSVTPNPAQNEQYINISGADNASLKVDLLDVLGRTVPLPPAPLAAGGVVRLDVSAVSDGVYYLRVSAKNGHAMRRVVIQR